MKKKFDWQGIINNDLSEYSVNIISNPRYE